MIEYIFGNDTFTARRLIAQRASGIPASVRWIDKDAVEASSVESILDSSRSSLLGSVMVVLQDPSLYSEKAREALAKACEASSGNVVLWDSVVDGRSSFHKKMKEVLPSHAFYQPAREDEMVKWVASYIQTLEPKIDMKIPAVRELVSRVGCDVWSVTSEIEKLRVIPGEITVRHVVRTVSQRQHTYENAFPLLEAMVRKQSQQAIAILASMQNDGVTERFILAMLAYQFRLFLAICMGRDRKDSPSVIAQKTGLHPIAIGKAMPIASRLSVGTVMEILGRIAAAEKSLTTKGVDGRSLITMLVVGLCR